MVAIILVEPQMGENIGAAARAMKNFGLSDLRIISPRDGWPSEKAQSMSVGAIDLIEKAELYSSVPDAIADLEYIYAATAASRDMNKGYVLTRDMMQEPSMKSLSEVGVMFGRESSGLNNKEISYANKILTIDTDVNFSSLNIAHAVAVIGYEIFQSKKQTRADLDHEVEKLATNGELEYFYEHLFEALEDRSFFKNPEPMKQKIRNIFTRIDSLSQKELQSLRGVITCLSNKR